MTYRNLRHRKNVTRFLVSASGLVLAGASAAYAAPAPTAQQVAQSTQAVPEEVTVTGSLIGGQAPVGLDLTQLGQMDIVQAGAVTTVDLFKTLPEVFVINGTAAARSGNIVKVTAINIHDVGYIDTLMLIDGMRFPLQSQDLALRDPSVVPTLALGTVDVYADGASATYGADAVAGVVNLNLKRNFDGAVSQVHYGYVDGASDYKVAQLYGRTWGSGGVVASFEWYLENPVLGSSLPYLTMDYTKYVTASGVFLGGSNLAPLGSSVPATIVAGGNATNNWNQSASSGGTGSPPVTPTGFPTFSSPVCTNCFQVPAGTGQPGTLTYNQILANPGTNVINPNAVPGHTSWVTPLQQRSGATLAFDQDVTENVHFFFDFLYSNRQGKGLDPSSGQGTDALDLLVPSSNPYYPTGAPAGGLRVEYNGDVELQNVQIFTELAVMGQGGLDFTLPFGWHSRFTWDTTGLNSGETGRGVVNLNAAKAAVGQTVSVSGITNGQALAITYTKPASVPYLNVFCDPLLYTCNDPATLAYMSGSDSRNTHQDNNQAQLTFDGKVFSLPGGNVKLAVGADYYAENFRFSEFQNTTTPATNIVQSNPYQSGRQSYSGFGELYVPVVGDMNAFTGVKKLEINISGRYDHYSDFGSTMNPAIRADWEVIDGIALRGSWSTGFRPPTLNDTNTVVGRAIRNASYPVPGSTVSPVAFGNVTGGCAGEVENLLLAAFPTATSCAGQKITGILEIGPAGQGELGTLPGNATCLNGSTITEGLCSRTPGAGLLPETSTSYSFGIKIAPPSVPGLDLDIGYFNVLVNNEITQPGNAGSTLLSNSSLQLLITYLPDMTKINYVVNNLSGNDGTPIPTAAKFIADAGILNAGQLAVDGIDFKGSYTRDFGDFGTWNVGVSGTWYNHWQQSTLAGEPLLSYLNTNTSAGRFPPPLRLQGRAQLGWALDMWSVNLFANYQSSYGNVGLSSLGIAPGYVRISSYTTLDLSVGYNLGDTPANDYLKNISFQFTANNFMDRKPPVVIAGTSGPYDASHASPLGRALGFTVTKSW